MFITRKTTKLLKILNSVELLNRYIQRPILSVCACLISKSSQIELIIQVYTVYEDGGKKTQKTNRKENAPKSCSHDSFSTLDIAWFYYFI